MASISLSAIKKSFGETAVLNGVSLDIYDGEFITLVGPSGCGKSTLLRILAGLEAQDAGNVCIDEQPVNAVRAADRNLAMVFQSYALYPHLTVAENMMTPLKLRDLSWRERLPLVGPLIAGPRHKAVRDQMRATAEVLKIEALLDRKPGQLSGGQRQRVALGRAMVRKPVAFLMDEPLSNLDAALRIHMRTELAELHRTLRATFVYVTHDQAEALTMSDRMAVMMDGQILQLDRPDVIYRNPADLRVAEFIGAPRINTLPGEIRGDGSVTCMGAPLNRHVAAPKGPVTIGVRPENLTIELGEDDRGIVGDIVHRENLGSDVFFHLAVGDGARRVLVRMAPGDARLFGLGDTVSAHRARGGAMVFDRSGARVKFLADKPAMAVA